jgi:hypothetical protein
MIIVIRLIILILVFNNFRLMSNKLNIEAIIKIFMEIKRVSYFLVKVILGIVLFLFLNYNSYVYYRLGLRIMYGYVFIYAFLLVLIG